MSSTKKVQNSTKKQGFQAGHPRYGGRQKGTPNKSSMGVREKLETRGIDIVDEFLDIFQTTEDDQLKINILKELIKYTYPQLKATDINVENSTGINIVVADNKQKKKLEEL